MSKKKKSKKKKCKGAKVPKTYAVDPINYGTLQDIEDAGLGSKGMYDEGNY